MESALLQETLHYSRNGAEAMPRRLLEAVEAAGGGGETGTGRWKRFTSMTPEERGLSQCAALRMERKRTVEGVAVISTLPMPYLAKSLQPEAPEDVMRAAGNLRFKAIAVYGLLVKKEKAIDALYIYYRRHVFHRVGEPKNAGLKVTPSDHTVLIVEMTCEEGDAKWRGDESILERVYADLESEGICTRDEVVETHILTCPTGYPIFDLGFEPSLELVQNHIASVPNLRSVGRQGGFCYPNMHQAMRMGIERF